MLISSRMIPFAIRASPIARARARGYRLLIGPRIRGMAHWTLGDIPGCASQMRENQKKEYEFFHGLFQAIGLAVHCDQDLLQENRSGGRIQDFFPVWANHVHSPRDGFRLPGWSTAHPPLE